MTLGHPWPGSQKWSTVTVPGLCKSLKRLENTLGEIKRRRSTGGRNIKTHYVICIENSKQPGTVLDELNSVSENTVFENSISENSKPAGSETVNGRLHALIRNRTGNKDVSQKRSRTSDADPRVKQVADYWCPKFSTVFGDKYPWSQKDGQIAKDLLRIYSLERLIEFINLFFESKDEFVCNKAGFTFGVFKMRIPALISTNRAPKNERPTMPEFGL